MVLLPRFAIPTFMGRKPVIEGITCVGLEKVTIQQPNILEIAKKYGPKDINFTIVAQASVHPKSLARLVAKIAYGCAIAQYGLENFSERYSPSVIIEGNLISHYVGCLASPPKVTTQWLHNTLLVPDEVGHVGAYVRLFAPYTKIEYFVIVGKLQQNTN